MILGKVRNENSVRYITKDNQSHSEQASQISKEGKRMLLILNFHKTVTKFRKFIIGEGFGSIKMIINCYF